MINYTNLDYNNLTTAEHLQYSQMLIVMLLKYIDGDTFKTIVMAQQNDYLLRLINDLKGGGHIG